MRLPGWDRSAPSRTPRPLRRIALLEPRWRRAGQVREGPRACPALSLVEKTMLNEAWSVVGVGDRSAGSLGRRRHLEEAEDLALMRSIARRDRGAFQTLYSRYAPRLSRYAFRLLRRQEARRWKRWWTTPCWWCGTKQAASTPASPA